VPVIICNHKQGYYSDHRICKMMILNETHYNPAISTFLSVVLNRFEKIPIRKTCFCISIQLGCIHTISGESGTRILLHRKGKLTIVKSKSPIFVI
jgi:hypothetical protein